MMEMRPPRMARISGPSVAKAAMSVTVPGRKGSANRTLPPTIRAARGRMPMMVWLITDLPEPDSPTSATVPPCGTRNDTPLTASIWPPSTLKETARSSTRNRSVIAASRRGLGWRCLRRRRQAERGQIGERDVVGGRAVFDHRPRRPRRDCVEAVDVGIDGDGGPCRSPASRSSSRPSDFAAWNSSAA